MDIRDNRAVLTSVLVISHIVIPCFAIWLITFQFSNFPLWVIWTFTLLPGFDLLYLTGYWGTVYWHFRTILALLFAGALFYRLFVFNFTSVNFILNSQMIISLIICIPLISYFLFQIIKAKFAKRYPLQPVNVSFPLRDGNFVISDGGNGSSSKFMNYHFSFSKHSKKGTNYAMIYAVDVIQISSTGAASWSLFPDRNEQYPIWGKDVLSPVDGVVISTIDSIDDNIPFGPRPYNVGNQIIIQHDNFLVLLGHLQKFSIKVKTGDKVTRGQPIAKIGNSGMSERPHLHMQAMKAEHAEIWKNQGLPIIFDGKNPVKNTRFRLFPH